MAVYLSVFSPNARKYGPEITPYLDTFHAVCYFNYSTITFITKVNYHRPMINVPITAQKMKFSIKDFFSQCDQILNGKFYFFVQCM